MMVRDGSRTLFAALSVFGIISAGQAEALLERGAYLMNGIVACGNCHTIQTPDGPMPGKELAGGMEIPEPGAFVAYVPNITPDVETGIGGWSDEEIIIAIREGRRPDGSIIGPPMPIDLYRDLSDTDVQAIVAYMRNIPAVRNKVPASQYNIPLPPSYGPPVGSVPDVDPADTVAYGAYLVGPAGHCTECHSPAGPNGVPDRENRLGAGGFKFHGPWGTSISPNITPVGIGNWSDDEIKTVITKGTRPDGSRLMPPMGISYYANINDRDLDAIVAYLRTLERME